MMSPTGTSNQRWACETRAKAENLIFFSFVLYPPTRASAGSPIRDLQFGREVALPYRVTWKMMTTFEFGGSGSSTLATSAAVKTDSTLPARANQARFDTNEHANFFFLKKMGSLGPF